MSLAYIRQSMTILPREILTTFLPQSLWHLVSFHMPSDIEELRSGQSEVPHYPSMGRLLLGHVLLATLTAAFHAGYSLQVV